MNVYGCPRLDELQSYHDYLCVTQACMNAPGWIVCTTIITFHNVLDVIGIVAVCDISCTYMNVIFRNHISYQVPRSLPHQPRLLPVLFCFTSVQESKNVLVCMLAVILITKIVITAMMIMVIEYFPRDVDWRIFCLKITRTREEVSLRADIRKKRMFTLGFCQTWSSRQP